MLMISLFETEKKQQHDHAHRLLRECLRPLDIDYRPGETALIKGELGKPSLAEHPGIHFNLSHADGIAACIVSERECGIDCERVRPYRPNVVKRAFSEEERAFLEEAPESERDLLFFRFWTLKESYVKALGTGISYPMDKAGFSLKGTSSVSSTVKGYSFRQYIIKGEYIVSVCERSL